MAISGMGTYGNSMMNIQQPKLFGKADMDQAKKDAESTIEKIKQDRGLTDTKSGKSTSATATENNDKSTTATAAKEQAQKVEAKVAENDKASDKREMSDADKVVMQSYMKAYSEASSSGSSKTAAVAEKLLKEYADQFSSSSLSAFSKENVSSASKEDKASTQATNDKLIGSITNDRTAAAKKEVEAQEKNNTTVFAYNMNAQAMTAQANQSSTINILG